MFVIVRNERKELASEASVLCTGIPLDVVEISDKHKQDNSRWNAWMENTCAQPLIEKTDTNYKLRVHSTITFCTYSYTH